MLAILSPAKAQTARVTNARVDPTTGIFTWTFAVSGVTLLDTELFDPVANTITQVRPLATDTSVSLHEHTNCCTINVFYRARVLVTTTPGNQWTSPFIDFTYIGPQPEVKRAQRSKSRRGPTPTPTQDPARLPIPTQDHSRLPAGAEVRSDSPWIQFREIEVGYLGQQSVIDAGAREAIDIWGPLGVDAEVCFAGLGSLLLLDAAFSPRRAVLLESYLRDDGKTCAQLDRAGTLVLMPGMPSQMPTTPPQATPTPAPTANPYLIADPLESQRQLSGCMINSDGILNFRASPAGRIISWYAGASEALARTRNWFKLSYMGEQGWISAHFVTASGDCG